MLLDEFYQSPADHQHPAYKNSFFVLRPAPEYATGEVLMASLYRKVGFSELSEKNVPTQGNSFYRRIQTPPKELKNKSGKLSAKSFCKIIDEVLKSPKQPNQSKQRFLQLMPLVPELALYTSSARLRGNPWNPGELIQNMLRYSTSDENQIERTWKQIFETLDVRKLDDDIWARFLSEELVRWRPPEIKHKWKYVPLSTGTALLSPEDVAGMEFPAKRFHKDLCNVLDLKHSLTRRQWISMLESILRIGSASHVLWICHVHSVVWMKILKCIEGSIPDMSNIYKELSIPPMGFWAYEDKSLPRIKALVQKYYIARIGINQVLHILAEIGIILPEDYLSSVSGLQNLFQLLVSKQTELSSFDIIAKNRELLDQESRELACAKGVPSNMLEFLRYSLSQRQTTEVELKGYDQGYYLRKKGLYSAAPWIVTFGPVSAMTLTYCCAVESKFPRNIVDFCKHLVSYGVYIHPNDFPTSDLGSTMANLGLILDSPDAEGGMMISSPLIKRDTVK
ncbi:hypothetical protein [uncultured Sphaerochaeta sp.]|uniref:hypothetical protein n=1 Tax=uncultured Sphaerochaeta sp. TaxID=886478 RepID=UPI0029C9C1A8|nr:hypothetical protein [uncultured Sphaerochaeta sp.]